MKSSGASTPSTPVSSYRCLGLPPPQRRAHRTHARRLHALRTPILTLLAGVAKAGVLLFIWNALKFLVNGPITLIVLIRARLAERRDRRLVERESVAYAAGSDLPVLTATRL